MDKFLAAAIEEARVGGRSGGIPIGSVLVIGDQDDVRFSLHGSSRTPTRSTLASES